MSVRAAAPDIFPGSDFRRATGLIESELAAPHMGTLPELSGRGHHGSLLGRTIAQLSELYAELTSYGWRLVQRPGADQLRAGSLLSSDVDTLADVRGERKQAANSVDGPLALNVLGPLSLAAQLHLPTGEKVLIDHGARRDLADSLAAGITAHIEHVHRSVHPRGLSVVLLEPDYHRVRSGAVPTVSGYQSIRSLHRDEARQLIGTVLESVRAAGVDEVFLDLGGPVTREQVEDFRGRSERYVDGFSLPIHRATAQEWERTAELVESGAQVLARLLKPSGAIPEVSELVASVSEPWQRLGMPASSLSSFVISAYGADERRVMRQWGEAAAMRTLSRLQSTGAALSDAW